MDLAVASGNTVLILTNNAGTTHTSSATPGSETIEPGLLP